jgi:hypothetical protein
MVTFAKAGRFVTALCLSVLVMVQGEGMLGMLFPRDAVQCNSNDNRNAKVRIVVSLFFQMRFRSAVSFAAVSVEHPLDIPL